MRTRLKFETREQWLAARTEGIGASEVGTILGVNPWCTPLDLWRKKTGQAAPEPENNAMLMGHLLEDAVAQRWAIETGLDIIKSSQEDFMFVDPEKPWLRASPDRTYWLAGQARNDDNKGILECKTTMRDIDEDTIPQSWYVQLQYNMGIAGYSEGWLAWLKMGRDFGCRHYDFDPELFGFLVGEVTSFWHDNVLGGVEPEPMNAADMLTRYPRHTPGKSVEAEAALLSDVSRLKELKAEISERTAEKEELEGRLKMAMGDAEALTSNGETIATWKAAKDSSKFDSDRFKAEQADMYAKYLRNVPGSRRFLIK